MVPKSENCLRLYFKLFDVDNDGILNDNDLYFFYNSKKFDLNNDPFDSFFNNLIDCTDSNQSGITLNNFLNSNIIEEIIELIISNNIPNLNTN